MTISPIAHFHSPFPAKFGIPKQSGLVEQLPGTIVFEPSCRNADALRGIEGFDYLWLLWEFSANKHEASSLMVRPPLMGGNTKMGVFATRSPFRPNPLGLSSVRLERVDWDTPEGPVLHVLGADLMDGTPVYDIKPYIPYADSHPQARAGFVDENPIRRLTVEISQKDASVFTADELSALVKTLELDPRPHYHNNDGKIYGMLYLGHDVKFMVADGVLKVVEIVKA